MTALRTLGGLLALGLLTLQVFAAHSYHHVHRHQQQNSTLESRYALSYPYSPQSKLKRGLPFNNPPKYIQNFKGANSKVSWAYSWDSYMDPAFPKNVEYVPMLWGDGPEHTTNVRLCGLSSAVD